MTNFRIASLATVSAAALLLTACGDNGNGDGDGEAGSTLERLREEGSITVAFAGEIPYSYEDDNGELTGATIALDASSIEDGRTAGDLAFTIDRTTTEAGAYPVLLVSYLIGCEQYEDENVAALTKAFFETAVSEDGQESAATNAGSAPISADLREQSLAAIALIK